MSLYFTVRTTNVIVVFGPNRMRNIMLSVFRLMLGRQLVCKVSKGAKIGINTIKYHISSRIMSRLRKVNGNMDSAKYQNDI